MSTMELDVSRGTAVWGFNQFRSDALARLLDDLVDLERVGLPEHQCAHVQTALKKVVNRATELPDGSFWRRAVWAELQKFEDLYVQWNGHEGADAHLQRERTLRKLRKRRNAIARRSRKHQYILQNELDLKLVGDMYKALGELATTLPEIFKNLSSAVSRFNSRN